MTLHSPLSYGLGKNTTWGFLGTPGDNLSSLGKESANSAIGIHYHPTGKSEEQDLLYSVS